MKMKMQILGEEFFDKNGPESAHSTMALDCSTPSPKGRPTIIIEGSDVTACLTQFKSASVQLNDLP